MQRNLAARQWGTGAEQTQS